MIYEQYFSTEWESLDRDEAMVRAFVLGIAAVREGDIEANREELDRLREASNRAFVEMAYKAGKRECMDIDEEAEADSPDPEPDGEFSTDTSEILSELVAERPEPPDRDDRDTESGERGERRARSRVDIPAMLDEYDVLDSRPRDDREKLGLPEFLEK
ncbi:hypothetical protein [Halorussus sp. AFM4]|uniref:hypothetical protein n=1 Tax=Halorussus sp. AFM4 TaxID=3421651 RepID=UPI003EBBFB22